MCGIAGICNINDPGPVQLDILGRMVNALNHRGPDEAGAYIDDWIAMGQARLSIIDLTGGSQPISNEDSSLWIIFNGEIFNYPELKQDLIKNGHKFKTLTDTEVILHLYEEKGSNCLDYLNGQFAFAIWNNKKHELFLARDRFGILPLYYTVKENQLVFASEIKAIFNAENVEREIDLCSLDQIFTFWAPIPGMTIFNHVSEIPPGHFAVISNKNISVKKYWDFKPSVEDKENLLSLDEMADGLKELILDAVKIRLRADVPVGAYLSGGLDSSGITAVIKNYFNNDLRTFGIRFEEEAFDEGSFQLEVVKHLNTKHSEVLAVNEEIADNFDTVMSYIEQPILRVSPVPLFFLSETVNKNNYKVVLTGEGADEIFGGYDIFKETKIRRFWAADPGSQIRPELLDSLYPYIFKDKRIKNTLRAFFMNGLENPESAVFSHLIRWSNTGRIKKFFSNEVKEQTKLTESIENFSSILPRGFEQWDYLSKAQYIEIKTFMGGYLLSSQGDRMAMSHSVELRPPYLDHRLAEYMVKVPSFMKLYGLNEKLLLKKVFKNLLPENIIKRHKNPYRAPINQSLLSGGRRILNEYCNPKAMKYNNIFNIEMTEKLFSKALKNNSLGEFDSMALAGIMSTQVIAEKFINNFEYEKKNTGIFKNIFDRRKIFSN